MTMSKYTPDTPPDEEPAPCDFCGGDPAACEDSCGKGYDALEAKDAEIARLRALLQEFVDRVDRGEIRSRKTYAAFKAALTTGAEDKP